MSRTHYKLLLDGEYLGQWDLSDRQGGYKKAVVEIVSVERFVPKRKKAGEVSRRLKVTFRGKRKAWLAGPTSQKTISDMYGDIIEDWIGKRITLYVDTAVMFGRKRTGGIRVENRRPEGVLTEDALDQDVDEAKAKEIADAVEGEREPGED